MSDKLFVRHCSPTILRMKTGNMFTCRFESEKSERDYIKSLNQRLVSKGLRVIPLRRHNGSTLIYVYRPSLLKKDLKNSMAHSLLEQSGYSCDSINKCIVRLIQRLRGNNDFPHEIGLFLGYPPEDVYGFIENKARCCKCVGCWKVYGDEIKARHTFDKYKKCTELCCSLVEKGFTADMLAVSY